MSKVEERTEASFRHELAALHPEIDEALDRLLPEAGEAPKSLATAIRYSIFAGGKRVRPALVVLAGEAFGAPRERLLPGAAAVEMLHTFSLIHDDLPALDDDDLRRGRPTLHRAYGEAMAVLAGDALLDLGLRILATEPGEAAAETRCRAVELIADAVGVAGMIGGQVADLEAERSWPEDAAAALQAIHRRKTGALLTGCMRLGGLYAEVEEAEDRLLAELGDRIGLAFQIGDDILDVEGSSANLGKAVGKDARARKLTYPELYGLAESKRLLRRVEEEGLALADRLPHGAETFRSLVTYLATRDR